MHVYDSMFCSGRGVIVIVGVVMMMPVMGVVRMGVIMTVCMPRTVMVRSGRVSSGSLG
jgi:hypothetical protein